MSWSQKFRKSGISLDTVLFFKKQKSRPYEVYIQSCKVIKSHIFHERLCCSCLHRLEPLRQAQEKDGNSRQKVTSSKGAPSTSSLYRYYVALLLHREKWITIIRLWWLSQWLVNHGHHPPVDIYLHAASSPSHHSYRVKFCTFSI